jgi:hypothetical protein
VAKPRTAEDYDDDITATSRVVLAEVAAKFRAREAEGPTWIANFLARPGTEEHERLLTDAFMTVTEVLRLLG